MAGFSTHISVSTAVGVGYGLWLHSQFELPWTTAAVTGGLCAVSGMLPDLDSDSGIPARETIGFTAAVVPMLLMNRFYHVGMNFEQMLLIGIPLYLFIRFGLGTLLKEFTIHRGMFHSIPAMLLAGFLTFLISDSATTTLRALKGVAVSLGYLSHLVLDEIWSVEVSMTGTRLKSSSGTALKFFSKSPFANSMCWGLLILVGYTAFQDSGTIGILPGRPQMLADPQAPIRPPRLRGATPPGTVPQPYEQPLYSGTPQRSVTPPAQQVPTPARADAFEPLPEWPPRPTRPLPAISERGVITPLKNYDQARSPRTSFPE